MSFRINTNTDALTALTNLNNTSNALSSSINRLSTGLKINSAADDPAGFIRAQDLNAQLSGITQALANNQDAINYAKTAGSALGEVTNLLNSARTLAVAAGNSATLDSSAVQANQSQLNSIISSINRIAGTTQFGTKNLLDGSAGVVATNANGANFSALSFSGEFNSAAITTTSAVTVAVATAATQAQLASTNTFATGSTTVTAGSFSINGTSFTTTSSETITQVVQAINAAQGQTGVIANYNTANGSVTLTQLNYGSHNKIQLSDANGVLQSAAGSATASGVDATANVIINNGTSLVTVAFTGGLYGSSALNLQDGQGNSIVLTTAGNTVGSALAGQLNVNSAQFQIGGNAGQTASLSLGNFAASQLGLGAVSGLSLNNLDITTSANASNALQVIDKAISDVSSAQGSIGNFQTNVLQAQINSLSNAQQNITSSLSSIQDVNVAAEMTNYTKLQILEQAGVSVLSQANSAPSAVLKLLG